MGSFRRILGSILVVSAVVPGAHTAHAQRGPTVVEVLPVVEREVSEGQTFVGTVTPSRRAIVGSAVDGRVVTFLVEEGDRVEAGEPLAELLTETINLELEAAEAELDLRNQQQAELENGSRPDEIEQALARVEAAKAAQEYLKSERVRLGELAAKNAISKSEFERVLSLALESQKKYDEAKAAHRLVVDGPRPERIAQAKAQTAMQDAIVRRLRDQIKKHTIIARFAGYVTAEHTEVGQWVTRGDPVAEIVALDEVEIVAKVVESQIPYVHVGDSVRVEVPSLSDQLFTGSVSAVVPQADTRSRTFPVKVIVKNEISADGTPKLKAGMLARLTLQTGDARKAMLVPKDALVLSDHSSFVWVVDQDSVTSTPEGMHQANVGRVPVELGVANGDLIQAQGSLRVGDLIVVKGNERVPFVPNRPSQVTWRDAANSDNTLSTTTRTNHGTH